MTLPTQKSVYFLDPLSGISLIFIYISISIYVYINMQASFYYHYPGHINTFGLSGPTQTLYLMVP